ncbi:uncharacterized protein LOC119667245 [Teleopsis dalmanni]|uniref:uncharacterized protein LOC119667245 n=1 Tax=Teleopsis dalmanni TaxID=139649 RepID=UPI0018CE2CA2|nr:uncharacterized protein LOC119667245 [Teleopsis dalmanni]
MAFSTALSLYLMEFLSNTTQVQNYMWKLELVNDIIFSADEERRVETIVYFGESTYIESYITASSGTPKVVETNEYSDINFYDGSATNRNIFFIAVSPLEHKSLWNHLNNAFLNMQGSVRGIFIIPRHILEPITNLKEHFIWCWQRGFANVLVLVESKTRTQHFDIYGYNKFPDLRIFKLSSDLRSERKYFHDKFSNFLGYSMRTPAQFDPPRVFHFFDSKSKSFKIRGWAANMLKAFLQKHNGSLQIVELQNSSRYDILSIINQINEGELDISVHPYIPYGKVRLSYPIKMMQWCILVPFSGEIEAYEYFLKPFHSNLWVSCVVTLLYLSLVKTFASWLMKHLKYKVDLGQSLLHVIRLLLFLPQPSINRTKRFNWYFALCFIQASVLGFVLSNLYLTILTSLLTSLVFEPQIDTLQEMVERNIKIYVINHEIPILLSSKGIPRDFEKLFIPFNATELVRELLQLKRDKAFPAREDMSSFALSQQIHLQRPIVHIAKECITTIPVGFLIPTHSQFERVLNAFIIQAADSGLIEKWFESSIGDGLQAGIIHLRKDVPLKTRPLNLKNTHKITSNTPTLDRLAKRSIEN